jgi:signal transduction histidine kinase
MSSETQKNIFKPRSKLLQHLGDQLIGTPRLAVFELVKNAYDADAAKVEVTIEGIGTDSPSITVDDDGIGMSVDTIQNVWLVIAHDHKELELKKRSRTPKGRLPLGSKGLGRLSVHKLGNKIELITRAKRSQEVVVRIDWTEMMSHEFLDEAEVDIEVRNPLVFTKGSTGTRIRITELRETRWTRGEIRRLYRQITSISSPFGAIGRSDFVAILHIPDFPHWIERLPDPAELLKRAPWRYSFTFDGEAFKYQYEFRGIPGITREARTLKQTEGKLLIPPAEVDDDDPIFSGQSQSPRLKSAIAELKTLEGIGPISGEFYVFDLSPRITSRMGETKLIRDFLDENGGIRVYRDNIRVYDYGEKSNDWLGLDLRRVNNPTKGLSRNIVVGHVGLTQEHSEELIEKSNREGFIENAAYERFRRIVLGALEPLQHEREIDRKAIRELLGEAQDPETQSILEPVSKIRKIASDKGLSGQVDPLLDRIEHEYGSMKERLLSTGISGTSLAVVFHEIEQGVRSLYKNIESRPEFGDMAPQVRELMQLLDGFADLLRKKDRKPLDLHTVVKRARDLSLIRFRHHNIKIECPPLEEGLSGPVVSCSFGLTLGALTNLIDNSIFWLRTRWPDAEEGQSMKSIFIDIDEDYPNGPAIIVADNGPGFLDAPSDLVRPFYSRRPDGMGMGLYYANMVMELNEGSLEFPSRLDTDVPEIYDGAIIALRFHQIKE